MIGIVDDILVAGVEVLRGVSNGGEIALRVEGAAAGTGAATLIDAGGVVDNGVGDDADPCGLAGGDHGFELLFGSFLGVQVVAHRLIGRPPLSAFDGFLRRRDLNVRHAFRSEGIRTFLGDRLPVGLEHSHDDIAAVACRIEISGDTGRRAECRYGKACADGDAQHGDHNGSDALFHGSSVGWADSIV